MLFDTPNVQVQEPKYELYPKGVYRVSIQDAKVKPNKSSPGRHISVTLEMYEGELQGRKLFCHFNIEHTNPQAVNIGRSEFKKLLSALGVARPIYNEDEVPQVLIGRLVFVDVGQRLNKVRGEQENFVRNFATDAKEPPRQDGQASRTPAVPDFERPADELDAIPF